MKEIQEIINEYKAEKERLVTENTKLSIDIDILLINLIGDKLESNLNQLKTINDQLEVQKQDVDFFKLNLDNEIKINKGILG